MATDKLVDFDHVKEFISREAALDCFTDWIDRYGHEHTADEMVEYQRIEKLTAADVRPVEESAQLLSFAHWVAKMVCVSDERWEDEYSGYRDIFPELACRKLHKLGIVGKSEDGNWVYPGMPL